MMITNGVDPYNGSTSILNQDSPYVAAAVTDAQRAGVAVSSIYYRDAGFRRRSAAPSAAKATSSRLPTAPAASPTTRVPSPRPHWLPYFQEFQHDISETYVATFNADPSAGGRDHLVRLQMKANIPKLKLRHADEVRPGNHESAPQY